MVLPRVKQVFRRECWEMKKASQWQGVESQARAWTVAPHVERPNAGDVSFFVVCTSTARPEILFSRVIGRTSNSDVSCWGVLIPMESISVVKTSNHGIESGMVVPDNIDKPSPGILMTCSEMKRPYLHTALVCLHRSHCQALELLQVLCSMHVCKE
jgi:hypothetical protein